MREAKAEKRTELPFLFCSTPLSLPHLCFAPHLHCILLSAADLSGQHPCCIGTQLGFAGHSADVAYLLILHYTRFNCATYNKNNKESTPLT